MAIRLHRAAPGPDSPQQSEDSERTLPYWQPDRPAPPSRPHHWAQTKNSAGTTDPQSAPSAPDRPDRAEAVPAPHRKPLPLPRNSETRPPPVPATPQYSPPLPPPPAPAPFPRAPRASRETPLAIWSRISP